MNQREVDRWGELISETQAVEDHSIDRAIAVPAPSPLGLRPEPVFAVSAIRRVSTIALRHLDLICIAALIAIWAGTFLAIYLKTGVL